MRDQSNGTRAKWKAAWRLARVLMNDLENGVGWLALGSYYEALYCIHFGTEAIECFYARACTDPLPTRRLDDVIF